MIIAPSTHVRTFAATCATAACLATTTLAASPTPAAAAAADAESLPEAGAVQLEALLQDKAARSHAERKISSNLIYAARIAAGKEAVPGVASLQTAVSVDREKTVLVDIRAVVTPEVLELIKTNGGEIKGSYPETKAVMARLPLSSLEALASDPRIIAINVPKVPVLERSAAPVSSASGYGVAFDQAVEAAAGSPSLRSDTTPLRPRHPDAYTVPGFRASVAEGDVRHRARAARLTFGINGAGLKVGVLSDSFDAFGGGYRADINSGDLPGPGNPNGLMKRIKYAGSGDYREFDAIDEGRAMCQIIHAVLPGAQIYFATAFNSSHDFANNIRALRGIAREPGVYGNVPDSGCDIIVDDVGYGQEAVLRDGATAGVRSPSGIADIKQAVNDVVADGAMYFASAGNSGNKNDGSSGTWEGDFADAGAGRGKLTGSRLHNWNVDGSASKTNTITSGGGFLALEWSDPLGQSSNDYDIVVFNNERTQIIGAAVDFQDGDDDPTEGVYGPARALEAGAKIVIVKWNGARRFLSLETGRGRLQYNTDGHTRGHDTAPGAFGIAATPTTTGVGPSFPIPFRRRNQVERFSSDGPRRVFFDENNIPYNGLTMEAGGGVVRQKPDLTGADGAPTSVPGFERFYGTSAAAPHVAAISGLVKAGLRRAGVKNPRTSEVRDLLQRTAVDIEGPGVDRDSGYGIVDAFKAVQATRAPGGAGIDFAEIRVVEAGNHNNNGRLEPGERARLEISLANVGIDTASNVAATLSTNTPGVTLLASSRRYPDIAPNETASSFRPYAFELEPGFECSRTIRFQLVLNYIGAAADITPQTHNFEVETGLSEIPQFFTALNTTPPPENPRYTAETGLQIGRLLGTGVPSSCENPKETPPKTTSDPDGKRRYDAYTIMNDGPARCITVTYNPPHATPNDNPTNFVGCAAYRQFNPEAVRTGYLGDGGSNYVSNPGSYADVSYSFMAPANAPFTVVVFEATAGGTAGNPPDSNRYGLKIDGVAFCEP